MRRQVAKSDFGRARHDTERVRSSGISPALFYGLAGLLLTTNALAVVAFLMSPDIAALVGGKSERVIHAYEDRIAQLRLEVDRLHARQYAQAGNLNLQLQELSQQQDLLAEQHQYVRVLAEKAAEFGLETAQTPAGEHSIVTGSIGALREPGDILAVAASVSAMMQETRLAMTALSDAAESGTDKILTELEQIGITPELPRTGMLATGGPFIPEDGLGDENSLVHEANAVIAALDRFKAARDALEIVPIHKPMRGSYRVSSNFGSRRDPFTGRAAFHSGTDFPAPRGTIVLSAGAGTVVFAGRKSGYGNVVDVAHGNGLVTRYAHMSSILASAGEKVDAGMAIGKVGSTGRSTGPHLHFEVRQNDRAVDPKPFLRTGARLAQFL